MTERRPRVTARLGRAPLGAWVGCALLGASMGAALGAPAPGAVSSPAAAASPPPASSSPPAAAVAAEPVAAPPPPLVTPQVEVVGRRPRALDRLPGTASVVKREDLRQLAPQSAAEVLRTVPGLNLVPEDGMGLRVNVGIRGLDPNRSRKVLVLEDGMPISLNPYGAPELYYSPPIERMDRVEVVKGSGQLLWGPQTVGGVINYLTRDPPRRLGASADLRYGSFNYLLAQAGLGATHGPVGWRVDVLHRRFDGPRRLDLALTDVTGKLRLQLTPRSILGVKLSFYDESSRATYLGLSTAQYAADPSLSLAEHDRFLVRRYALGLTHQQVFSAELLLQTTVYAYETSRVWRRQLYDRTGAGGPYERACDGAGVCGPPGAPDVMSGGDRSSVFFSPEAALRDRVFTVGGVEPRLTWSWAAPRILTGELTALLRFHYERARAKIVVGSTPTAESGDVRDDELRSGYALAAAVQSRFSLWQRLHLTPGVRLESYWSDRHILRAPVTSMSAPPPIVGGDVDVYGRAQSFAFIPGLGVAADVAGPLTLYSGVHRGYAPPRSQDAVGPTGENLQLEPELSWNVELGARLRLARFLTADAAGFHIEFENQIIPPSLAGGAVSGASYNTGHSRHTGLEASVTFDAAPLLPERWGLSLPLTVNYTYLPLAAFVGGLYDGNRLPYAPEHLLFAQLRLAHRVGVSAQVSLSYASAQFADKENTQFPSRDGLIGELPGYAVLDARIAYTLQRAGLTLYVAGKGLTGQIYIASRAPEGIQPAGFRQLFGGVEWAWPPRP